MGSVLKIELKKAFCNKMFCLVLGIGLVIAGISAVQNVQIYYDNLATIAEVQQNSEVLYNPQNESITLYNGCVSMDFASSMTPLFYTLMPLLVCLAYGWSYFG